MSLVPEIIDDIVKAIPADSLGKIAPYVAIAGAVIKIGTKIYEYYAKQNLDARRIEMMDECKRIRDFLSSLPADDVRSSVADIRERAENRLDELTRKIADSFQQPESSATIQVPPARGVVKRLFLLYVPRNKPAWFPQIIAWALGVLCLFGIIGVIVELVDHDEDAAYGLLGMLLLALICLVFRGWAVTCEYFPNARNHGWVRAVLLLYRPLNRRGWWTHIAYYIVISGFLTAFFIDDEDTSERIGGLLVGLLIAAAVNGFGRRYDTRLQAVAEAPAKGPTLLESVRAVPRRMARWMYSHRIVAMAALLCLMSLIGAGMVQISRLGTEPERLGDVCRYMEPSVSANGQEAVVAVNCQPRARLDIWLLWDKAKKIRQLTHLPGDADQPSISPDGSQVFFHYEPENSILVAPTTPAEGVSQSSKVLIRNAEHPAVSPDGNSVLFETAEGSRHYIRIFDLRTQNTTDVAPGFLDAQHAVWRTGGHAGLIFQGRANRGDSLRWWSVDERGAVAVLSSALNEAITSRQLRLFAWNDDGVLALDANRGRPGIWLIDDPYHVINPQKVPGLSYLNVASASASPRGMIYFQTAQDTDELWSVLATRSSEHPIGEITKIRGPSESCREPSFGVKRSLITFTMRVNKTAQVFIRDTKTGADTQLTSDAAQKRHPMLSGDLKYVAFESEGASGSRDILLYTLADRSRKVICSGCGSLDDLSYTADAFLEVRHENTITYHYIPTNSTRVITAKNPVFQVKFSPDYKRILCQLNIDRGRSAILIGSLLENAATVQVTGGESLDYSPAWSTDGHAVFFLSKRDGHACLWRQDLGPDYAPQGSPVPVLHFHRSWEQISSYGQGHIADGDQYILSVRTLKAELWRTRLAGFRGLLSYLL